MNALRTLLISLLCFAAWSRPASAISPEDVIGREATITLEEAVELALQHNLDLQVARVEPALSEQRVREADGSFDPRLFGEASFLHNENPIASPFQAFFGTAGNTIEDDIWNYEAGFSGVRPWGIEYSSAYVVKRTESSSQVSNLFPEYRGVWESRLSIPLLKNLFHNDAHLAVRSSRIGKDISEDEFRRQLTDIVVDVEAAYWELAAARAALRVAEKSLEAAHNLLEQTRVRHQVGVVSRVEVTEAEAGVAAREFGHIQARNRSARAEDELLQRILAPERGAYSTTSIQTEEPTFIEYQVDESTALERALAHRPEIEAARRRVEDSELRMGYAWNQQLPELDLNASYTLSGLSGKERLVDTDGDRIPDAYPNLGYKTGSEDIEDDFFNASGAHGWGVGATVSIPLGNETAQSRYVQRKIENRRVSTELHRTEQQIVLDVRNAVRALQDSRDGVSAAERRKASEAERLRAEQERLRLGDSTPQEVLEIEEDLAEAERQEISALQVYRTSITALERAQATLLDSRAISIEGELTRP